MAGILIKVSSIVIEQLINFGRRKLRYVCVIFLCFQKEILLNERIVSIYTNKYMRTRY